MTSIAGSATRLPHDAATAALTARKYTLFANQEPLARAGLLPAK
jgi:hypothetical protein